MDDEEPIVRVEKLLLEELGYDVVTATSSSEALHYFRSKPQDVDLVITDMTMPNMTGDRFSRELLSIRSDVPIILCTGFSEKINSDAARSLGIRGFLMKPLLPRELAHLIRSILNGITNP